MDRQLSRLIADDEAEIAGWTNFMTGSRVSLPRQAVGCLLLVVPLAAGIVGVARTIPPAEGLAEALCKMALPYRPAELQIVLHLESQKCILEAVALLTWSSSQRQQLLRAANTEVLFSEVSRISAR